ncbi:MAG: hypothetical protein K8S99_18530 [Planctomycetes bacterium]|nr:hypothetical protein [Planctomycetota bacterium]
MGPYLSIVSTARNDDHGGNLLGRMQLFLDSLAEQCDRFSLPAELILVEWNPPADRPPLAEALRWPARGGALRARVIRVPAEVHARFRFADRLPLFQMIGKNVGIRRASAPFVLATNIDLLFSDELIRHIAARRLRPDRMYRVDRYDVEAGVPADAPPTERFAWCDSHLLRVNQRGGILDAKTGEFHIIYWKMAWRVWLIERLQDWNLIPIVTRPRLHLNACGDFTLLAMEQWRAMRAYPELQMFSMHLDSVLCTAAHFGGAREQFLPPPMKTYHVEHGKGWSPRGEKELNDRLASAGIDQLDHQQFHRWAIQMRRERKPMMFNDENWGLANEKLREEQMA